MFFYYKIIIKSENVRGYVSGSRFSIPNVHDRKIPKFSKAIGAARSNR